MDVGFPRCVAFQSANQFLDHSRILTYAPVAMAVWEAFKLDED